jgi:hypothetical protein
MIHLFIQIFLLTVEVKDILRDYHLPDYILTIYSSKSSKSSTVPCRGFGPVKTFLGYNVNNYQS